MAPPPEPNPAASGGTGAGPRPSARDSSWREQPAWPFWLPVGLSSLLLVLFVVVVNRQQAQAEHISELIARVQSLEQSRTLERTAVLEQQLRSMLSRLQALQKQEQKQEQLARGLQNLEQEVQQLRAFARPSLTEPADLPAPGEPISRPGRPRPVTPLTP